jgi:dihydrofolate reductase
MRKLIFSINLTLDGFIDHTAMTADDELHERAEALLRSADVVMYGRVTWQLLSHDWPLMARDPSLSPSIREFGDTINRAEKIVYSRTLQEAGWNTRIARQVDPDEILAMKAQPGRDILLGPGASIARAFMDLDLIDEYQFIFHPVILGRGIPLFRESDKARELSLVRQYTLHSGVVELTYRPAGR